MLTQPKFLSSLCEEYADELTTFRRQRAPQVKSEFQSTDMIAMDKAAYLHLVGALLYLTKSRPDMQTAVSFAATHSAATTRSAFNECLRCLSYLSTTLDIGLVLRAVNRMLVSVCLLGMSVHFIQSRASNSLSLLPRRILRCEVFLLWLSISFS